mgnify:CR=1 FL=1
MRITPLLPKPKPAALKSFDASLPARQAWKVQLGAPAPQSVPVLLGRELALAKIMPMQKGDFIGLFREMKGLPVTIRLLDPPIHEFLPTAAQLEFLRAQGCDEYQGFYASSALGGTALGDRLLQ